MASQLRYHLHQEQLKTYEKDGVLHLPKVLDELNLALIQALMSDGYAFLSSTRLAGRAMLRLCTINPRTTEDDIDRTLGVLDRLFAELVAG